MKRLNEIEKLETIQRHIERYDTWMAGRKFNPHSLFAALYGEAKAEADFNHNTEIMQKARAFWVRKFNRILEKIKY